MVECLWERRVLSTPRAAGVDSVEWVPGCAPGFPQPVLAAIALAQKPCGDVPDSYPQIHSTYYDYEI